MSGIAPAMLETMSQTQILASGLVIRQDFAAAVRPVFFQTEFEEFLYATHGGTLFLVSFRGKTYGLTCRHVFQDFALEQLFIAQEKQARKGSKPAPIKGICYPSAPVDGAVGTDLVDVAVIEFSDDMPPDFFEEGVYLLDERTAATSQPGHKLLVAGVLKEKSWINPPDITIGYCRLEFTDVGLGTSDPTLRTGTSEYKEPEFQSITGISGSPVFGLTANALCGMVVRGGMTGNRCQTHFVDMFDIMCLLEAINRHATSAYYTKNLMVPVPPLSGAG
jgi:hypothetical protein